MPPSPPLLLFDSGGGILTCVTIQKDVSRIFREVHRNRLCRES